MNSNKAALERIIDCASRPDARFLELAEALHNFRETFSAEDDKQLRNEPLGAGDRFLKAIGKARLSRRRVFYLQAISRVFGNPRTEAKKARLKDIGWSKLALAASYADKRSPAELLNLAEEHSLRSLKATLSGKAKAKHCVILNFTDRQYKAFENAVLANGGRRHGRGLTNKKEALFSVLGGLKSSRETKSEMTAGANNQRLKERKLQR